MMLKYLLYLQLQYFIRYIIIIFIDIIEVYIQNLNAYVYIFYKMQRLYSKILIIL